MSKQRVRNKIYALIITVTLFMSVNNLSEAEEKSTVAGMELADNAGRISSREELDNDDRISDIKSRYTTEEVELGNELSSKKAKKNRRNSARQAAKGKGKTNNVFEADRETKHDLKVGSIEFSNLKELSPDLLLSKIPVKSGDSYTNKKLSDIYLSLKRLGYISEANVYPKIRGNTVNIMVEVAEVENASAIIQRKQMQEEMKKETEYTVASIDIEGLQTRRKEEYLKNLPIKPGDIFVPQKAVDGAQKIFDSGYFSTVEPKIDRKADNTVSIVYEVKENPAIQSISFEGNTLYKDAELEKALGIKKGEILNGNLLNPDKNGIIKLYNKDGYSVARIESINVSNEGDIKIGLSEGVVDSVEFEKAPSRKDNERQSEKRSVLRTKPYIFERVQKIKPGQIFQTKNIKDTVEELYRTGMFTSIEPVLEGKEDDPNARVVKLLVEERPTTTINGSISYGTSVGLVGELKLADSNFLGKGQDAAITLSASNKGDKTFDISWFDPWIRGTERVQAGGTIYWNVSVDDNADPDEVEKVKKIGTRWTIGKGLNSDLYVRLAARYDHYEELFSNKKVNDKYNLLAVGPSLIYDTRNNQYSPTKGIYSIFSYERGELINDPRKYDQFEADLRAYHPTFFGDKNVMAYRVAWGSTGSGTPEALRFSIGGAESIRGYDYSAFDGYDKFHATIENRTKINDTLQLVAFFDIGNAWQKESKDPITGKKIYKPNRKDAHDFKDLKKGYGVGVRLNTPIGPLRFDYGWPMDPEKKGEKKDKGKFYFSFGQSF
ncbi:outer membrane protein [Leptotrichia shahii]|uniref:Outer membrane protein n=1 Tax=Leptotrichia shahii TaxID=157691 RepID=A0A510JL24_9FUSO|nr:BamA/TamA family outer membrane protein [Leptotrichia shahii]BBM40022.1 outer membrane protein [Leptotrichia shahii]